MSNLTRTVTLMLAELQRWRRPYSDLSPAAFQVLAIVEGAGVPLPPRVIGERMLTTSGSMTSLLDTLERRGLIRRRPHPDDRRMLLVDITDEARAIVDVVLPATHRAIRAMLEPLVEGERQALLAMLGRLEAHVAALSATDLPDEPPPARRKPRSPAPSPRAKG